MKIRDLDKEIIILTKIISQLYQCLEIQISSGRIREQRSTLKDISLCKHELKKMNAAKKAEMEAEGAAMKCHIGVKPNDYFTQK